jgi:hypothetical protein
MLTIMSLFQVVTISMQGLGIIWNFKKQNWVEWLSSSTCQWDKSSTHSCLKREFPTVLIPLNQYKSSYVPIHVEKLDFLQKLRTWIDTSDCMCRYKWLKLGFYEFPEACIDISLVCIDTYCVKSKFLQKQVYKTGFKPIQMIPIMHITLPQTRNIT